MLVVGSTALNTPSFGNMTALSLFLHNIKRLEHAAENTVFSLHTVSRVLGLLLWAFLFSSPHSFSIWFMSGALEGYCCILCVCVCVCAFFFFPMSWYFTGFMMPCTLIGFPGPFGEETGPQRYGFSTVHNRHEVLFHSLILCFMLNLPNVSMGWNVDKFHSNGIQWTVCHSFLESSRSWARDNIRCVLPELSREKELVFCLVV